MKKEAVLRSIKKKKVWGERETWEHWANIRFDEETSDPANANIRVGFDTSDGSWSSIGQLAKKQEGVTLNLGDLDSVAEPSGEDFGTILHEFGHVLGMAHEHQSPIRPSNVTRSISKHFSEYVQSYGRSLAKSQILDVVDASAVVNLSRFDPESIMM